MVTRQPGPARIVLFAAATIVCLVLLFGYRTSLGGTPPSQLAGAQPPGVVSAAPGATAAPPAPRSSGGGGTPAAGNLTVNGTVAQTRWGPVQVQVSIAGGKITDVVVLQRPSGNRRDEQINAYALPRLRTEVLQAQSARIDTVSGATVTSDGYVESLQAALDSAHFGR
ncbi:FMN-binding protein [Dactylosporangium sp. CA-092794]|uniref:FMN-binding protein n=1 Tax=Dactylosporangium sp. CA-092794 TaxID=3239929 RepID=UPI003D94AAC7